MDNNSKQSCISREHWRTVVLRACFVIIFWQYYVHILPTTHTYIYSQAPFILYRLLMLCSFPKWGSSNINSYSNRSKSVSFIVNIATRRIFGSDTNYWFCYDANPPIKILFAIKDNTARKYIDENRKGVKPSLGSNSFRIHWKDHKFSNSVFRCNTYSEATEYVHPTD